MKKKVKYDTRPDSKRPKGAIYSFEKREEHQANKRKLKEAQEKVSDVMVKVCNSFNTWVSGGNKQSIEQLREKLEPSNFITST